MTVQQLSLNFQEYFTKNRYLSNLISCDKITDKGLEVLGTEISRHLLQLQQLYLDFSWYFTKQSLFI